MAEQPKEGVTVSDIVEIAEAVERGDVAAGELADRAGVARTTLYSILKTAEPDPRIRTAEPLVRAFRELMAEKAAPAVAVVEPAQEKESA